MQYRYSGPLTALTLPDGQEVILTPGRHRRAARG